MRTYNENLINTILSLHRDADAVNRLWHDKATLLPLLECALTLHAEAPVPTAMFRSAAYLVNHLLVFFARTGEDLGALLRSLSRPELRAALAGQWLSNDLIALADVSALARSPDRWTLQQFSAEDGEWLARLNAQYLLKHAGPCGVPLKALLPDALEVGTMTQEYVLAWAYEEGKLDEAATQFFAHRHPAKFEMLKSIVTAAQPC